MCAVLAVIDVVVVTNNSYPLSAAFTLKPLLNAAAVEFVVLLVI